MNTTSAEKPAKRKTSATMSTALLFVFSCTALFAICEAIVRYRFFGPAGLSYSTMKKVRNFGVSGLLQASPHLDIAWELRPNTDDEFKFYPFKTNSAGLRDREYSHEKPNGVYRVAVIGDSFTMGEGIPIEAAYHTLLEDGFNALENGKKYEFINFAVAGYSLVQYVATIRHKVGSFHPDLILIGFCGANDSEPPNMEAFKTPYKVKPEGNGFYRSYFSARIGDIYKRYYKQLRGRTLGYDADPGYVEKQFRAIAEAAAELKTPVVVAYIGNRAKGTDFELVQSESSKHGFDFIDGTTKFSEEVAVEHIIFQTDTHPNALANKLIAQTIFPELRVITATRNARR